MGHPTADPRVAAKLHQTLGTRIRTRKRISAARRSLPEIRILFLPDAASLHFLGQCLKAIRRVFRACPVGGVIFCILAQFGGELSAPSGGHIRR
jgi:hypothetical protein